MCLLSSRKKVASWTAKCSYVAVQEGCPAPRWAAQVPRLVLTAVTCLTSLIHCPFPLSFSIPGPFFQSLLIILLDSTFPPPSPPLLAPCSTWPPSLLCDWPRWTDVSISDKFFIFGLAGSPPPPDLSSPFFLKTLGQWDINMWHSTRQKKKKSVPNSEQRQLCLQNLETNGQLQIEILRIKATTCNPSLVTVTYS